MYGPNHEEVYRKKETWEILIDNQNYKCYDGMLGPGGVITYDIDTPSGNKGANVLVFRNGGQPVNIKFNAITNDNIPIAANEVWVIDKSELLIHNIIVANNASGAGNATYKIFVTFPIV
jgi:hypothetical protein